MDVIDTYETNQSKKKKKQLVKSKSVSAAINVMPAPEKRYFYVIWPGGVQWLLYFVFLFVMGFRVYILIKSKIANGLYFITYSNKL